MKAVQIRRDSGKVENAEVGIEAKIQIRRHVLEVLTPARAVVFDAFAGPGAMWAHVWREAARYVGCDEQWYPDDERVCYAADNRRVMRCLDLAPFTVFDFDAYGSPWQQALILAARRPRLQPGERIGIVITEGTSLFTRFSNVPNAMREAAGITTAVAMGAGHMHDELITRGLRGIARRMGGQITREWRTHAHSRAMIRYGGVIVEGDAA